MSPSASAEMAIRPSSSVLRNWRSPCPSSPRRLSCGHPAVLEGQAVGVGDVPAELAVGRLDGEARRAARDHDGGDQRVAVVAHPGPGGDGDDRGDRRAGVRDERLGPVMTQSPASLTALVRVAPASEPPSGSVRPNPARARPETRSGSHSFFCASEPKDRIGLMPSPTPADRVIPIDWSTRPSSSIATHSEVKSPSPVAWPPYSSGTTSPKSPSSPILGTRSTGKWDSRSHCSRRAARPRPRRTREPPCGRPRAPRSARTRHTPVLVS